MRIWIYKQCWDVCYPKKINSVILKGEWYSQNIITWRSEIDLPYASLFLDWFKYYVICYSITQWISRYYLANIIDDIINLDKNKKSVMVFKFQAGGECYCGSGDYSIYGESNNCAWKCTANTNLTCGGTFALEVFNASEYKEISNKTKLAILKMKCSTDSKLCGQCYVNPKSQFSLRHPY